MSTKNSRQTIKKLETLNDEQFIRLALQALIDRDGIAFKVEIKAA